MVAVSADYQGRVMTSSSNGKDGKSYGWINRDFIAADSIVEHMNPYGGEDRFWLGPEGGQFSIFFEKGQAFTLENWQTPSILDTEPFELKSKSSTRAIYEKKAVLQNYSGFTFNIGIERTIQIFSKKEMEEVLSTDLDAIDAVGYKSINKITNLGAEDWNHKTGLLSIWILGMFNPSDQTTICIPYKEGNYGEMGPIVNDDYFGKVPPERLKIRDGLIYFRGDGQFRSKIGLSPTRAKNIFGSYDGVNQVLTIVKYSKPQGELKYVNSSWKIQEHPYEGDVINSYNDGAPGPDKEPLGPFYELETSSPALGLASGESGEHSHYTFHFEGNLDALSQISNELLGVSIKQISGIF